MIKVDEFKLVEVLTRVMSDTACEAYIKEVATLNDVTVKKYLQEIIQENLLELDDKDCENLWAVINFCFDNEEVESEQ